MTMPAEVQQLIESATKTEAYRADFLKRFTAGITTEIDRLMSRVKNVIANSEGDVVIDLKQVQSALGDAYRAAEEAEFTAAHADL